MGLKSFQFRRAGYSTVATTTFLHTTPTSLCGYNNIRHNISGNNNNKDNSIHTIIYKNVHNNIKYNDYTVTFDKSLITAAKAS